METTPQQQWHSENVTSVLDALGSKDGGLTDHQVTIQRQKVGENRLLDQVRRGPWLRLASQFHNILLYVLLVAAALALLMGHVSDAVVITMVVLINALVGFVQEGKAEAALQAIQQMLVASCRVWRGGQLQTLDAACLVPGDRVVLAAGDRVPADLRLLSVSELYCDESTLTGESVAVAKFVRDLPEDTPLAEQCNMAWMGSLVTSGSAEGVVVATGIATQLGQIGELVATVSHPETPLTRALNLLARQLAILIVVVSALGLTWAVLVMGMLPADLLPVAVGIVVAAIPEGLPAIVTIALAIGVQRMAKSHAVIRKLPVVEVLGSVTVICSDKTGTLTRNEMTTRTFVTAAGKVQLGGEGYAPDGRVDSETPAAQSVFQQAAKVALLCNDAWLKQQGEQWQLHGDPTEGALFVMACKAGLEETFREQSPRLAALPFATERLYMATLNTVENQTLVMVKGAPERLLGLCEYQQAAEGAVPLDTAFWQSTLESLAGQGLRVLALASKALPATQTSLTEADLQDGLVLQGFAGTLDPPREEAVAAVEECRRAGIRVKMITGDNPQTAQVIASQVGLSGERVMTGKMLADTSDEALDLLLQTVDVFARTSPADKLRLVQRLQASGQVVAMTGDGVNDAPALQRADIGIAMGGKGTDAARDAAGMVLTDDNFATIAAAVREGRTVYDNIVKALLFILPTSLIEAMVLMVAALLGTPLPISPIQILWVNMITAVTLAMALAFEHGERDLMQRPPRPAAQGLVTLLLLRRVLWLGVLGTVLVFWQFHRFAEADVTLARNVAVLTLVWIEAVYLFACRRILAPAWSQLSLKGALPALTAVLMVMILQWGFSVLPFMQALFVSQPLGLEIWLGAMQVGLLVLVAVELEKAWLRYRAARLSTMGLSVDVGPEGK